MPGSIDNTSSEEVLWKSFLAWLSHPAFQKERGEKYEFLFCVCLIIRKDSLLFHAEKAVMHTRMWVTQRLASVLCKKHM